MEFIPYKANECFEHLYYQIPMELFFNITKYMTTLKTVTDCTFLVLSREQYRRWIWDDKNALQLEVSSMGKYLLEQNRVGRVFLFLQGMDRILYMFVLEYESHKQRSVARNYTRRKHTRYVKTHFW